MPLNPRQQKFVEGYLAGKTAKKAYIDAGYKARGHAAESGADQLMRNSEVSAAIEAARGKALTAADATAERTIRELARLAYLDPRKLKHPDGRWKELHELDDDTAAAVAGLEYEAVEVSEGEGKEKTITVVPSLKRVRLWDKKGALELLMKHLGLLKDRVEVTGEGGGPVVLKVISGVRVEDL